MILVLDNYDSFTFNLVQYLGELGAELHVVRNDKITVEEALALKPEKLLVSPGPCSPKEAGISCALIRACASLMPVFGVCLGHQSIGAVFGGEVVRAERLMHGKTSPIHHDGTSVFKGLSDPFEATRYHSLIVERSSLPKELRITAWTEEGEIMGMQHTELPVHGVQFHPESILTLEGKKKLQNLLNL
jgi:anthranilate synthase/aminodeoxychorismate synthase-like glutamine amidotransferase